MQVAHCMATASVPILRVFPQLTVNTRLKAVPAFRVIHSDADDVNGRAHL